MPPATPLLVPKLVIFHEITRADVLKMQAQSNETPSGGGARDLRFNYEKFDGVFREILPGRRQETRRRGGSAVEDDVYFTPGEFLKYRGSVIRSEVAWYSPTDVRPREGRISQIHKMLEPPATDKGRVFVLFIQSAGSPLRLAYAYQTELTGWYPKVADILAASLTGLSGKRTAQGYLDLMDGRHYIHV